jgi:hypothetical protein
MTVEVKKPSYRGVLCRGCRQPIPLPAIVESAGKHAGSEQGSEHSRSVFSLRCRACDKEHPYRMSDVQEFEGTPRSRTSRLLRRREGLSHAANA